MTRCDLHTHRECSCIASGVSCRVQSPLDLGTYRGTNHPGVGQIINGTARDLCAGLVIIITILVVGLIAAEHSFSRVERVHQADRRV